MLIDLIKKVLADTFSLYLKAHYYHWNVEGPNFKQYHDFFGDFYEEVFGSIDKLAEHIRVLGAYAPGSFKRFVELSTIEGEERILQPREMIAQLLRDNQLYTTLLMQLYDSAEKENELGLSNFIQDRIEQHKKHEWMLKSFLKAET